MAPKGATAFFIYLRLEELRAQETGQCSVRLILDGRPTWLRIQVADFPLNEVLGEGGSAPELPFGKLDWLSERFPILPLGLADVPERIAIQLLI